MRSPALAMRFLHRGQVSRPDISLLFAKIELRARADLWHAGKISMLESSKSRRLALLPNGEAPLKNRLVRLNCIPLEGSGKQATRLPEK